MIPLWATLLMVFGWGIGHLLTAIMWSTEIWRLPFLPTDVHDELEWVNWFGATVLWLLYVIVCPLWWFITFIIFLFTVGRD